MAQKEQKSLHSWQILLLVGVLITALVLGILQMITKEGPGETISDQPGENPSNQPVEMPPNQEVILNNQTCTDSGGTWNECGSACRENSAAPCIQVCVPMCECASDDQCPYGLSCGAMVDGVGICE